MYARFLWTMAVVLVWITTAIAQQSVNGATLTGEVHDPSGAAIVGGRVSAVDKNTGRVWTSVTDDVGHFKFAYLNSGDYLLRAEGKDFDPAQVAIHLLVGQAFNVPLVLKMSKAAAVVDVSSSAPIVETVRTQVSDSITPEEIDHLPLNGRNYLDLALLVPGVSKTNTGSTQKFAETSAVPGTGISVAGQRNLNNNFIVDGLSANDDAAELAGTYFSQEVIRDFQVVTSGVAEFGRGSSGVINIETHSGTNAIHGGVYGFLRNQRFDATNPLSQTKLPLTQAQYGASAGGPIVRNRTFYFVNFEQTRQNTAGVITIPDASVSAINARLLQTAYPGQLVNTGQYPTSLDTTNVFARLDQNWTSTVQSSFRYSFYDVQSPNSRNVGGLNALSRAAGLDNQDHTLATSTVWTITPRTLLEARAQYTRNRLSAPLNDLIGPAVNISGVASFGTATVSPTARNINLWEGLANVSHQHGSHSIKAGFDFLHDDVTINFPGAVQGVYSFSNLNNLLAGNYVNYQQAFGPPATEQSNPNVGMFVEDEWRVASGLTLNAGIRYEIQMLSRLVNHDTNNVAPRLGIAWDPIGDGKTVIRANYGLYFDRVPLRALSNALQRDGVNYKVALMTPSTPGAPLFPDVLTVFPAGILTNITTIDPDIQSSYATQASLQIERALTSTIALNVGYQHLRGEHLVLSQNLNVPTTTDVAVPNLGRPNPDYANNSQYRSIGDSWYDGLMVSLNKRSGNWGTFRVSYTFSKSLDDAGNFFFSTPQDNFNVLADKGRSDNDQRHRLSGSGTITPPAIRAGKVLSAAANGWQFSYVISYSSALPFNIQTGNDRNGDTNNNDRPAGVGRNTGIGFSYFSFDTRVARLFRISERTTLTASADIFNLFNHRNNMVPNNIFGTGPTPRPTFGLPTAVGEPRQVQLGLRVAF
jgi:hypothetical protein